MNPALDPALDPALYPGHKKSFSWAHKALSCFSYPLFQNYQTFQNWTGWSFTKFEAEQEILAFNVLTEKLY